MKDKSCCGADSAGRTAGKSRPRRLLTNKFFLTSLVLLGLVGLSYKLPALLAFRTSLLSYLRSIWWAVLLGFFLGGIIERFVPREYVSLILARKRKRTIFSAVVLGFLMSSCSHGILALSIQLYKKGASIPVVVAFLLASPWANMPITILLLSFFGLKALYILLGAMLTAFFTGIVFQFLERRGWVETNPHTLEIERGYSIREDFLRRAAGYRLTWNQLGKDCREIVKGALGLADMVLWWILLGAGLASLAAAFIPHEWFQRYMGPTALGLLVTLALATVMEVCSEGTAPFAFEIFKQTGAFGNAFVFLMAGVVTDFTEIGLIGFNVGWRTAVWIPLVAVPQVILLGIAANGLF
ncbi:MAG: permease [Candidatus Omnitrophica bacterium]|nr:permease [Candidatus Omnitrophota bacterium]